MPRPRKGNAYQRCGKWYARVTVSPGVRPHLMLPTCADEASAQARAALLNDITEKLRPTAHADLIPELLERAAVRDGKALDEVLGAVELIAAGKVAPKRNGKAPTLRELGRRWTSGELALEHPDHVKEKSSADNDVSRLDRYVYPVAGDVPIDKFTLDHAELVMRGIPPERASATRRHVAQLLHRLCAMAVFPLRLIAASPLPRGFLPKVGPGKAKGWIYPDEDARLLASVEVPLAWRVFYGFLHREGLRRSEAARLTWRDFDLERGSVTLDENKTDDPRAWALSPGVAAALRAWREVRAREGADMGDDALVFVDECGEEIGENHAAERYREHLRAAGITRPVLFEKSKARQPIRLHDTRATFITIALANGKNEAWVQDRTGHRSSVMINRYRRAARTAAELGLGELGRMDGAIPKVPD
ncbi:tyrosine-type recombinase/integrase [Polyangium aurulentum]|uniref:tyrosine-type recombinase/integrase n=1 Tax=Polyangium aurulentum TaxID=2567896 RepID=UPI00200D2FF7|nr:tyrosine-type recombinase/integrase [Polyangium aurulentum]UQA59984.1 tyrosine-type recombinase/integrase [Polyangium aurulentum]